MIKKLVDINCYAINLVEDHPGYSYVEPLITDGLRGKFRLIVLDVVPFRVHWIMTRYWEFDKAVAQDVILHFIQGNPNILYLGLNYDAICQAFELSKSLNHDIYDCYYLAGAISSNCESIITTDTDFERLCKKLQSTKEITLLYENPVPKDVLTKFSEF